MTSSKLNSFPPEVIDKLGFYVYRLIDPRNGDTFYVGKGKDNRVFQHIAAAGKIEGGGDETDNKIRQIREIQSAGLDVGHVIHRHGMNEPTAFQVEAALMDAYPGLTNTASGVDSGDYGSMHALEIITAYRADEAVFQHKAILINVNRTFADMPLYEATRYAWKIGRANAMKADFVLPTVKGIIKGAFVADDWLPAIATNFPTYPESPGRLGFIGREAPDEIKRLYMNKRVPDEYRQHGAANPIRYTWKTRAADSATSFGFGLRCKANAPPFYGRAHLYVTRLTKVQPAPPLKFLPIHGLGVVNGVV